jgi:SAM-dependent methyltransferase
MQPLFPWIEPVKHPQRSSLLPEAQRSLVGGRSRSQNMSRVYNYPRYYEIAFSFRDIAAEVGVMEECMRRFSKIPVKTVLELGCGNCPHAPALCGKGYRFVGIDTNPNMIEFSRRKTETFRDRLELFCADMNCFDLDEPVDFVLVQVGSLFTANDLDIETHFDSVAKALKPGGLYFLDGCVTFGEELLEPGGVTWELERGGTKVTTNVFWETVSRAGQLFNERISFEVDDHGKKEHFEGVDLRRAIYPQEFLQIIKHHPAFEFVGWWHLWDLNQPLEDVPKPDRAIVLVRRI